jgi:hypothetical protein
VIGYHVMRTGSRVKRKLSRVEEAAVGGGDYDVFISYGEEESEWVDRELRPELEEREPKFRACIRERDFEIGVTQTENTVDCLDRSRRFLLVVSPGVSADREGAIHQTVSRIVVAFVALPLLKWV